MCSERCSSGDPEPMGPGPSSATGQGSFLLLLLTGPLAGQPRSHTPRGNSSLCLATAASFTLTGTPPLTTFWETDLPGSFHFPFQGLLAVRKVSLGSNLNTFCGSFSLWTAGPREEGSPGPGELAKGKAIQCVPDPTNPTASLTTSSWNIPPGTWEIKDENKQGKREGLWLLG